ncbi:MAG: CoA transferase, partial [Pseudomonadota bacterium]
DWAAELNAIGVPAGAVMTVPDILAHPQVADRGMLADFSGVPGVGRDIRVLRTGIKVDRAAPAVGNPPPLLGQDNAKVWGALGIGDEELEILNAEGVI